MLKIPVSQYDKEGNFIRQYESIAQAARSTGADATCITSVCRGMYKSTAGFVWRYTNGYGAEINKATKDIAMEPLKTNVDNHVAYENLANTIVSAAASDLRAVLEIYKNKSDRVRALKSSPIYKFFYSDWYNTLTSVDGDYIVKSLIAEIWDDS